MKSTGIVRRVDELGRIVLPIELRRVFNVNVKDPMEIYTDDDGSIILKKFSHTCCICGNGENLVGYKGKSICRKCISKLTERSEEE